jgi:hypothetical protein
MFSRKEKEERKCLEMPQNGKHIFLFYDAWVKQDTKFD